MPRLPASAAARSLKMSEWKLVAKHGGRRWRKEAREPSAKIYRRVFRNGEHGFVLLIFMAPL